MSEEQVERMVNRLERDADRQQRRADAAEAEVKRLKAEVNDLTDAATGLADDVINLTIERNALAAQVDDLRNVNAGLRIALSDPTPCTGTGSGGCDCLPDDED